MHGLHVRSPVNDVVRIQKRRFKIAFIRMHVGREEAMPWRHHRYQASFGYMKECQARGLAVNGQEPFHYIMMYLCSFEDSGLTIVSVSHDLNLAAMYSDRIAMLLCGGLTAAGTPQEVLTADRIKQVFRAEVVVDLHPATATPRVTMVR